MPQKRSLIAVVLAAVLLPVTAVLGAQAVAAPAPAGPKLHLQVGSFDPAAATPTVKNVPAASASAPAFSTRGRPALWVVQAKQAGAPQAEVVRAVEASGASVLGYVPDHAYAVYATPEQRAAFLSQAGGLIHFAGPFQPAWRVRPAVGKEKAVTELTGRQEYVVRFFHRLPKDRKAEAFTALSRVAGVQVVKGAAGDRVVRIAATADRLAAVATLSAVEWVNTPAQFKLHNATARWVNDTGNPNTLHLTKPVGGLTGAGQVAAVADTGINYVPDVKGDAQGYFSDCAGATCKLAEYTLTSPGPDGSPLETTDNNTGHRKMVGYFDLGGSGTRPSDDSAHGTHVAGSVGGNIAPYGSINAADGMAWAGRLIHENIADNEGGLGGIGSVYQLFQPAYRPSDPADVDAHDIEDFAEYNPLEEARTHNNSWGGDAFVFADNAIEVDDFVWDHEDMAIIFSAGNAGTNPETAGALGTVGAPGTAKNDLTSGASANGDQPMASYESAASFSSHGPTADGRYGPDLMTPGQTVISPKGSSADEAHYMQGTSMSGPVLTGLTTLVRQYFWDGYGPTPPADKGAEGFAAGAPDAARRFNPSAALVKAVMINGATRMRGFYTGDDGTDRAEDGQYPSAGQGFGQVNLDNSLYLPGDPTTLWVKDVWRDTNNGRPINPTDLTVANPEAFPGPSAQAVERAYQLTVGAGQPLDVTLAWTDAPNIGPAPAPALVNNLDLTVTAPDGTTVYRGNNFNTRTEPKAVQHETVSGGDATTSDKRNNVEKVRIAAPTPGVYTVKVTANQINSAEDQGFSLAATGVLTNATSVPAAPAVGLGWRTDAAPGTAPSVVGATVNHVSNDTVVVNVTTNELTKALVKTTLGGVFRSVDTVGPDGFPGLPSSFTEEIPDNTGFAPPPGAHDVVSTSHRIFVTGARTRDATMTVEVTDLEGKTTPLFLGGLSAAHGVYQAPLDDIAQFDSGDPDYGGFESKSTQLYVGNLGGNPLLGTYKFQVPPTYDTNAIGGAVVETHAMHDLTRHDEDEWLLRTELLPNDVEADWRANDYDSIHDADATARLNPRTGTRKGNTLYSHAVTCSALPALRSNLADDNAAFRMEADSGVTDSALSFEPGANRRSKGPHLRPNLVLYRQQANGTVLDPRPCDPNAPAPAISDVRVEQVPDTNQVTYSGIVSWMTDVPSDSTVLVRPRGSSALAWTEIAVPGRSTLHQVEIKGLSLLVDYEFLVHSASCNGKGTADTNGGAGYAFMSRSTSAFHQIRKDNFDADENGWTASPSNNPPSSTTWARETDRKNSGTHSWNVAPYADNADTTLTSPTFNTVAGRLRIAWMHMLDTEKHYDYLRVEYTTGDTWTEIAKFDGKSTHYESGQFDRKEVDVAVPASNTVQVRFRFTSDAGVSSGNGYEGVWVDDVVIGQGGPGIANAVFPVKAPTAASAVTAPAIPLRQVPNANDVAAGTARCAPITTAQYIAPPPPPAHGYWMTAADAGLFAYGDAKFFGSRGGQPLNEPIVGMASRADHSGYWQVASDGGVFSYGNAPFYGSMGGKPLNKPVVGMAALPDGSGYWLVASDGGIFAFGKAPFHGSTGSMTLNKPIVGMAAMPDGRGYWLVASDGGIFAFGEAANRFYGSAASLPLAAPIVGMEPTPAGDGYWLVGQNGAVFAYGAAAGRNYGSMAGRGVNDIVGMAAMSTAEGYWLVGANGGVYPFGKAPLAGAPTNVRLFRPIVGVEGF